MQSDRWTVTIGGSDREWVAYNHLRVVKLLEGVASVLVVRATMFVETDRPHVAISRLATELVPGMDYRWMNISRDE